MLEISDKERRLWATHEVGLVNELTDRPASVWLVCAGDGSPLRGDVRLAPALSLIAGPQQSLSGSWQARSTDLALSDGCLDGVVLSHCLEGSAKPSSLLDEALRVIRPGGQLCVLLWGGGPPFASRQRRLHRQSLGRLQRWALHANLQLLRVQVMRQVQAPLLQDLDELPLLQRWWQQQRAQWLRFDYRHGGNQPIRMRALLGAGRRVAIPAQGLPSV